ncbi:MAG: heme lyase CcmF/NrfE family subunit [Chloroflexi bacterium]|nr:heme lyase CcmF/NrfE family subunit [Chloroflexota bacterium]
MNVFVTDVGYGAMVIGLVIAAYTAVAATSGAMKGYPELLRSARNGVLVTFGLTSLASAALVYAFLARDFGVQYVAQYSSRDLEPVFTFAAWWAGQAGSLLLWAWMLAMFATIIVVQNKEQNRRLLPYATSIMMAILAFFLLVMIFAANPFERSPVTPADGQGLNPLLENFGMFFHPTTLYIGYVGFTVPFAFAMAALITKRLDDQWIRSTRRWTLFAWFFLGLGNLFGAQWAYVELGWGGYWGWDPVESASFMPWLTGTAYLHSVMIQQRRGMLKVWNMLLIIITFTLSIFGTLLTRSGILSSVHTFSQSAVGPMFMALIGVLLVFSLGLLLDRLALLKSENEIDSFMSREASFLLNNLLLVGAAFAVFWGTVFPLISEAVRGVKITVGPPFYNQVSAPIFLGMVILMGVCPLIGWRKASTENLQKFLKSLWRSGSRRRRAVPHVVQGMVRYCGVLGAGLCHADHHARVLPWDARSASGEWAALCQCARILDLGQQAAVRWPCRAHRRDRHGHRRGRLPVLFGQRGIQPSSWGFTVDQGLQGYLPRSDRIPDAEPARGVGSGGGLAGRTEAFQDELGQAVP